MAVRNNIGIISNIIKQPAIVLIDEVDAHLHPSWQRKITLLLRKTFPNVQFILTAHSPLVVGGCSSGEVSVLRRDGNELELEEYSRNFIGTSVKEIYIELFEIEGKDETYLNLFSHVPLVQDMRERLDELESKGLKDSGEASRVRERLADIERVHLEENTEVDIESLERENAQLRRQMASLRKEVKR